MPPPGVLRTTCAWFLGRLSTPYSCWRQTRSPLAAEKLRPRKPGVSPGAAIRAMLMQPASTSVTLALSSMVPPRPAMRRRRSRGAAAASPPTPAGSASEASGAATAAPPDRATRKGKRGVSANWLAAKKATTLLLTTASAERRARAARASQLLHGAPAAAAWSREAPASASFTSPSSPPCITPRARKPASLARAHESAHASAHAKPAATCAFGSAPHLTRG